MAEELIGKVVKFFSKPGVAAVEITSVGLAIGDSIRIKGHTTDFQDLVSSMQIDKDAVSKASPGDTIGIKVKERAREGDLVYKVLQD
jgi:translation elongation factor EF-1alpha